jgi:hypothetical protein
VTVSLAFLSYPNDAFLPHFWRLEIPNDEVVNEKIPFCVNVEHENDHADSYQESDLPIHLIVSFCRIEMLNACTRRKRNDVFSSWKILYVSYRFYSCVSLFLFLDLGFSLGHLVTFFSLAFLQTPT